MYQFEIGDIKILPSSSFFPNHFLGFRWKETVVNCTLASVRYRIHETYGRKAT
jgi:hypothetical protein